MVMTLPMEINFSCSSIRDIRNLKFNVVTFQEEMFVDVGVYGVPKNERFDAERTTRKVEEFVRSGTQHNKTHLLTCFAFYR